ncbi:CatB-related O-acetyltransferase [Deinococcus sp.]|uniref:CatB-related O-acetyltransferase n=1 Tax=Deinococcus sp. TaxID=47478 RepID=UPI0025E8F16A|nr:CatB-related O-acetyltransferase [Deinococcus sp.]
MKVHRRLEQYFSFDQTILLKHLDRHKGWEIGEYSYGHPSKSPKIVHFGEDAKLKIGNYCSFAEDVWIVFGGHHRTEWVTTYPFSVLFEGAEDTIGLPCAKGDIVIGNDVWVCTGAMIMAGVTIGNGVVVAARSVVTKDVPAYTVVAGNPAKPVKKRFSDDVIEALEQIQWWNWPVEKIRGEFKGLLSDNVQEFVAKHTIRHEAGGPSK